MKGTVVYAELRKVRNGAYVRVGARTEDGRVFFFNLPGSSVPEKGMMVEIPVAVAEEAARPALSATEDRIDRAVALKAAAAIYSGWAGQVTAKPVLELAEAFLVWLRNEGGQGG